jgi:beta-lactamase class A
MPLGDVCKAALLQSDNTAGNLLVARLGGPEAYTAFARSLGDTKTRLDRLEPALNTPRGVLDTTTPASMAENLRRLVLGKVLKDASRKTLEGWMLACETGPGRLKAGLPPGWRIAHKTGSGDGGTANDVGILYPPKGAPIVVAAYYQGSPAPVETRDAVLAEAARLIAKAASE